MSYVVCLGGNWVNAALRVKQTQEEAEWVIRDYAIKTLISSVNFKVHQER